MTGDFIGDCDVSKLNEADGYFVKTRWGPVVKMFYSFGSWTWYDVPRKGYQQTLNDTNVLEILTKESYPEYYL